MTKEELGRMTIDELEQAASRVAAALAVLKEAGAWSAHAKAREPEAEPERPANAPRLSTAEQSERRRLLEHIRGPELPADIAAMEASNE
jgi:hypothetical protein